MSDFYTCKNAVALIFYNRPSTFQKLFSIIEQVKPPKLFLICDGAKKNNPSDYENIQKCKTIAENISWNCEVYKDYSDENLGCGVRPYTGITKVFTIVESAIILEDDCIPEVSFFSFCDVMLSRYKNDSRVMLVSGLNHLGKYTPDGSSYFFSKCLSIWGWATWKRAWDLYDYHINLWESEWIRKSIKNQIVHKNAIKQKIQAWDETLRILKKDGDYSLSWWDNQWHLCLYCNSGLGIVPSCNLISNIGLGEESTHANLATKKIPRFFFMKTYPIINFEKNCPEYMYEDIIYDKKVYKMITYRKSLCRKIVKIIKKLISK